MFSRLNVLWIGKLTCITQICVFVFNSINLNTKKKIEKKIITSKNNSKKKPFVEHNYYSRIDAFFFKKLCVQYIIYLFSFTSEYSMTKVSTNQFGSVLLFFWVVHLFTVCSDSRSECSVHWINITLKGSFLWFRCEVDKTCVYICIGFLEIFKTLLDDNFSDKVVVI